MELRTDSNLVIKSDWKLQLGKFEYYEVYIAYFKSEINIQPNAIDLDEIAHLAKCAYFQSKNFTILHVVTSAHAMRVLLTYVGNNEMFLRHYWHNVVIGYLSASAPGDNGLEKKAISTWEVIKKRAIKSTNEHLIKIVYSSYEEYKRINDDIYLKAVSQLF